ncbi:MAG: flagellar hook-basal body complex protein FliE [Xanthobacteraceae bacterium]|nr:flagellar hook-basal body complex protein FliE [Xanthobacteraceae bacterium]QYK44052.1 MAG: flagellar hook-basal body complex protein FliE [Xanthobacteraceae bacterium]
MTTPTIAANAYAALQRAATGPMQGPKANANDGSFGSMLQNALGDFQNKMQAADAKMVAATNNKGDLVDVVTAVAETEVAVETLVSVRDRMIQAYEEIMRMPI